MINFYYKTKDYKALEIDLGNYVIYTSYQGTIALFDKSCSKLHISNEKISYTTSRHRNTIYRKYNGLPKGHIVYYSVDQIKNLVKSVVLSQSCI
jgi:hypothetical protein